MALWSEVMAMVGLGLGLWSGFMVKIKFRVNIRDIRVS